ncbi:MAG: mechanosensitive ion channel family protein [Microthrixaceae bacterium]|nr:mechanosensitive ion channel family protein [Microthrixaceae bacterium]
MAEPCGASPSWVCERVYEATENEALAEALDWLVHRPLKILGIVVLAWIGVRLSKRLVARIVDGLDKPPPGLGSLTPEVSARAAARARTLSSVLVGVATATIYTIAFLTILGEFEIDLAPLIAGAGIAGVALGFGAQSMVKDFLSGFFMIVEDQFGVGDVIDVGEATGTVERLTLRSTRLRSVDGTVWHVPNGVIERVGNQSQQWARALLDVSVAYGTDLRRAQDVIKATADGLWRDDEWRLLLLEEPELWGVEMLAADSVDIRLVLKTRPGMQWKVMRELRIRLKEALDAEGIEIPFQQRTLWIRNEGDPASAPLPPGGADADDDQAEGDR